MQDKNAPDAVNNGVQNEIELMVNTSPGAIWWTSRGAGIYSYRSFVLGGCGSGKNTPQQVAETISRCAGSRMPAIVEELKRRGWNDVLAVLAEIEREKKAAQIGELKDRADGLKEFIKKHEAKDYWYFRKMAYDQLRGPNGEEPDEQDVSVRRMHYAACAMMSSSEFLEKIEKQVEELEAALREDMKKM